MFPATQKYLTMLKARYGQGGKPASDYKIHQLLGVSKASVSAWVTGKNGMSDEVGGLIADLLELDPVQVLAELNLDRAQSRAGRQFYEEILKRLTASAALVLCGFAAVQPFVETGVSAI